MRLFVRAWLVRAWHFAQDAWYCLATETVFLALFALSAVATGIWHLAASRPLDPDSTFLVYVTLAAWIFVYVRKK